MSCVVINHVMLDNLMPYIQVFMAIYICVCTHVQCCHYTGKPINLFFALSNSDINKILACFW